DRRLGDVDTEFQQLAMNTWRTPQRVVAADCPDQIADVGRDRGPADTTARLPTPIQTEPAPMPAHQRLRLDDNRGFAHGRAQSIEPRRRLGDLQCAASASLAPRQAPRRRESGNRRRRPEWRAMRLLALPAMAMGGSHQGAVNLEAHLAAQAAAAQR